MKFTQKRGQRVTLTALLLVTSVSISACASSDSQTPDGSAVVAQNRAQWAMPLDEFRVFSPELSNYAEQLFIADCLTSQGYEWPIPWRDAQFPWPDDFNSVGLRLFDERTAAAYGYHFAPPRNREEAQAWVQFGSFANSYSPDATFDLKFQDCSDQSRSDATVRDADALNYISSLALQASDAAYQDEAVLDTVTGWRECLTEKVAFAVPSDPWTEMPPRAVATQFGLLGETATDTASAEEIAVAVADASCRESSGFSETLYSTEWQNQKDLVEKNRDQLDRIRAEATDHKDELLRSVAENIPAAR